MFRVPNYQLLPRVISFHKYQTGKFKNVSFFCLCMGHNLKNASLSFNLFWLWCFAETNYMILKNLMEEKQLDFNQPLLSVRRFSSTVASENATKKKGDKSSAKLPPIPVYRSELKSGPVRNPGSVPFVWEQTPGRPKGESKVQTQAVERPSITPKLPPGRVLKVKQQDFDEVSKGTSITQSRKASTVSSSRNVATSDKVTTCESLKEVIQEKASSDSDYGDEVYQDALDTLSRTESFFMNCSVSGLSGWDDQEVLAPGSFSTDQQARDFMIGRFLPAAKAMASETPQHTSRKLLVTQEQTRQLRKVVNGEISRPINPKWQKVLPHYAQDIGREECEDESDDDDGTENYAPKVCGLFPRFCFLNPVPGLRMEDRVLGSSVHGMHSKPIASHRRTAKEHAGTAYNGKKSVVSQSGFMQDKDFLTFRETSKHGIDPHRIGFSKLSDCDNTQSESSCESPVVEKTLYVDSVHKVNSSSLCSSEMKNPTNHRGDDLKTLREDSGIDKNPSIDSSLEDSKHLAVVDDKATLQPKSSVSLDSSLLVCSDNSSKDLQMEMTNHLNKIYSEKQVLTKIGCQESNLDHDLVVASIPKLVECEKIESESQLSSSRKIRQATKLFDKECSQGSSKDHSTSASPKVVGDGKKIEFEGQLPMKLGHPKILETSSLKLPLALPLPKAPSESWLRRTLLTASSKNISSWPNLAANSHARTQNPKDPNWEIIVKSSNVHHGHLRFAEEPLAPIPEA